ncbi:MAG: ComF family protein [Nevskia sp.]
MVDGLARGLRQLLLPPHCLFCRGPAERDLVCTGCRDSLPWNRSCCPVCALPQATGQAIVCTRCAARAPDYDRAWSAFRHEMPIAQAIYGLKYHAQFQQARLLGAAMAAALAARGAPLPALLLPVPLHASRLRRRGYNQALELARVLARRLRIEIDCRSASRIRATEDQIGQSAVERRRSVKGAFAVSTAVAGKHIAIIDDVMTTGSTVNELARACRQAGAARLEVWTAARAV